MLQDHMKRVLDQCKLLDDYAKDLDERGMSFYCCGTYMLMTKKNGPRCSKLTTSLLTKIISSVVHWNSQKRCFAFIKQKHQHT